MGALSTPQVAEAAKVSYRQMDYWRRCGVFAWMADVPTSPGSGSRIGWAPADVRVVRILGQYAALTNATTDDLAGLAEIAARHAGGYAVRRPRSVWAWSPSVPMDVEAAVVVSLSQ